MDVIYLSFILVLAVFLGFEIISKVPSTLHTPLMSGANAISGITVVGALVSAGADQGGIATFLGTAAVVLACGITIGWRYVASEANPADGPSRG